MTIYKLIRKCFTLAVLSQFNSVASLEINSSSTLNPLNFLDTITNHFYPFAYEVPPLISFIVQNETLRKNFTIGNPYEDVSQIRKGDTNYWPVQYCGVHFINKGEGYILSDQLFTNPAKERCLWGFVGDNFCTPEIECPEIDKRNTGDCRHDYLQITDAGSSFTHHFCDNTTTKSGQPQKYTARDGVLDVVFRYRRLDTRPKFQCWVKCVNYPFNYTVTGSNYVGSTNKLIVKVHPETKPFQDTIPRPKTISKCQCGKQNIPPGVRETRVVGGRETLPNQYPWTVGIVSRSGKLPYCGASLISAEYVLTAQHCIEDEEVEDIRIAINEHDFYNHSETKGRTLIRGVDEVINYNYYMESTFSGDIALLKLSKAVPIYQSQFTPVCLPTPELILTPGQEVIGAGWGTTSSHPFASKSAVLLEVPLALMPNEACNDYHPHSPPEPPQVSENMLCAGYSEGGRDTCAGDSGGPLTTKDNGSFYQVGVTSWGFGCALKYNPGVFSRVSAFMYWIRMHTVDGHFCSYY